MDKKTIQSILQNIGVKPIMPYPFNEKHCVRIDLSASNPDPALEKADSVEKLQAYVDSHLAPGPYYYALGGYGEERSFYARFPHFQHQEAARSYHLGLDIWTGAHTPVMAPLRGVVHSLANNDHPGDYGGTLILRHEVGAIRFHSLYGHLSPASIAHFSPGDTILAGQKIAELGNKKVNKEWPPHLHFQLIRDMEGKEGDYPGVVLTEQAERYRANCPNPEWLLQPEV